MDRPKQMEVAETQSKAVNEQIGMNLLHLAVFVTIPNLSSLIMITPSPFQFKGIFRVQAF